MAEGRRTLNRPPLDNKGVQSSLTLHRVVQDIIAAYGSLALDSLLGFRFCQQATG